MSENDSTAVYLSPSAKAWQTAKERAVAEANAREAENKARGERERQEMIRALVDPHLSHGAARLFCLLCKAGWMKEFGGLHRDVVGAVLMDARQLARLCGGASKNLLYSKNRPEKRDSKTGALIRRSSATVGWIEELVRGAYIWVSKQRVKNMMPSKWPNIYNVSCHVPAQHTPNLPFRDGQLLSENVVVEGASPRETRLFDGSEQAGDGETPENTLAKHRSGVRPSIPRGDSPVSRGPLGKYPTGGQASTAADTGQVGQGGTGKLAKGGQASWPRGDRQAPQRIPGRASKRCG